MKPCSVLYILLLWFFVACSSAPDKLGKLDLEAWRSDRGGCEGKRKPQEQALREVEDQLKGQFADKIGQWLGRPDIHQLGDRNQKFYVYYLEKGPQCDAMTGKSDAAKVILKFNAVGLLSEITYQTRPL